MSGLHSVPLTVVLARRLHYRTVHPHSVNISEWIDGGDVKILQM